MDKKVQGEFVIGVFDDEEKLVKAGTLVKRDNFHIQDFFTPFPVHGLDELLDIKRSRLPFVTFVAGGMGLILALAFQVWTSAVDWPINVGGKPMLSIPAFIPITFELMVLCGALTTVAAFLFRAKLFPGQIPVTIDRRQLDDQFLIVIPSGEKNAELEKLLRDNGAVKVEKQMAGGRNE